MSCLIKLFKEDQCVFLTYEGEMPPVEIMVARYEANELLAMKRWSNIVVDITGLRSKLTALELFELARGLSSELPQSARVALVVRSEQAKHARLIETVARNEGVALTYHFDMEKAKAWVKELHDMVDQPADAHEHKESSQFLCRQI